MTDLGAIFKESTLALEILTKNEEGIPSWADEAPSASVIRLDELGDIAVVDVKLITMSTIGEYAYELVIPSDWLDGNYMISYTAIVGGMELKTQETFALLSRESQESAKEVDYEPIIFGDKMQYILPQDFQLEAELEVTETGVIIRPKEKLKYNHTYMLVFGPTIASLDGEKTLGEREHISFTTAYSPLYATPLEVRAIIRNFFPYFSIDEVYAALRDAGEKAHVYKDLVPDANNSRFKMAKERDTYYFALTKYQTFEASRTLLTKLLMAILQGTGDPTNGTMNGGGESAPGSGGFTLGDLTVSAQNGGSSQSGSDLSSLASANRALLQNMLDEIEKDLKFWQDSMLGHHRRGYAKPSSASFRTAGLSPGSREF